MSLEKKLDVEKRIELGTVNSRYWKHTLGTRFIARYDYIEDQFGASCSLRIGL